MPCPHKRERSAVANFTGMRLCLPTRGCAKSNVMAQRARHAVPLRNRWSGKVSVGCEKLQLVAKIFSGCVGSVDESMRTNSATAGIRLSASCASRLVYRRITRVRIPRALPLVPRRPAACADQILVSLPRRFLFRRSPHRVLRFRLCRALSPTSASQAQVGSRLSRE